MKHIIIGLVLFLLQIFLTLLGIHFFNKYINPILLFAVSSAIPAYLIWLLVKRKPVLMSHTIASPVKKGIWAVSGVLTILVAYEELRKVIVQYLDPAPISDVIPQIKALYERFASGEFPYQPVDFTGYSAIPVYMPLHWLPVGLATLFHMDARWVGFIFLALATGVYGWFLASDKNKWWVKGCALVLPSLPLWAFILWGQVDIAVSFEIIIAAYYLVLAVGLSEKKPWMITLGIILSLLSRYTLFFWIPLFALLFLFSFGWKKSLVMWGVVATSVVLLYIIPFYSKDPTFLGQQLHYYTGATIGDWIGCCGDHPISWTQERGISFAAHMKAIFSGEIPHRIQMNRIVLGVILLATFAGGLLAYKRWRSRIDVFTFSLIWLYLFVGAYYFFGPLTYRYYLIPYLMLSAVLVRKIITLKFEPG